MESVNGNNTHLTSKRVHKATRPIPYPFKPFMSTAKGPLPNLQPRMFLCETPRPARDPAETVMGKLANRIWHVALARVEAGTMFYRWHGWGAKDTKLVGGRLAEFRVRQESINCRYRM